MNILHRIRSGDETALKEIYLEHREPFFAYIHKTFKLDTENVKELFQLSVVIFYDNVVTGKVQEIKSNIKTYLIAIGKNKAQEFMRKNYRFNDHLDEVLIESILDDNDIDEKHQLEEDIFNVTNALDTLGDPCKKILQMFYYQQLNLSQISKAMDYKNVDTTKNLKYKCIKRLQKICQQAFVG